MNVATRPASMARVAAVCLSVLVAIGLGIWAGGQVRDEVPAPSAPTQTVSTGRAQFVVPAAWRPARAAARERFGLDRLPGIALAPSIERGALVVASLTPPSDPSLLPARLLSMLSGPPTRPETVSFAGRPAWRYRTLRAKDGRRLDVTVAPTTAGVLTVVCVAPRIAADCAAAVSSVAVQGATALTPSAELALRLRMPAVLARLDRVRVGERAALRRARTPVLQNYRARRLAQAHDAAASALQPVAGAAGSPLVDDLQALGSSYRALARAAAAGALERFDVARSGVRSDERRLSQTIARRTRTPAPQPTVAPRVPVGSPQPQDDSPMFPLLVLLLGGALATGVAVLLRHRIGALLARVPRRTAAPQPTPPPLAPRQAAWRRSVPPTPPPSQPTARQAAPSTPAPRAAAATPTSTPQPPPTWRCVIEWHAGLRGAGFRAVATAVGREPVVIAESPKVSAPPFVAPERTEEILGAARTLARALLEADWRLAGRGNLWYDQRFAWPHADEPQPLERAEPAGWGCVIEWYAGLRGAGFRAVATAVGREPVVIAESPKVSAPPFVGPERTEEILGAARTLARALLEADWRLAGRGNLWYDQRFAWPHPHDPAPLELEDEHQRSPAHSGV